MPVEFIGTISTRDQSEIGLSGGRVIDKDSPGKFVSGGRIAVHIITGGHDAEQRADGDHLTKDERYARTDEYPDIVKPAWTESGPFGYHGQYYQVENHYSGVKSAQQPRIRLYLGGSSSSPSSSSSSSSSEAAYRVGGKHTDTYALWGEPLAESTGVAA
ncbi:LLM class flavin-dependent oxidoreductase [Streptomyces sp. NPDC059455]|uniref:LLM class flavin-dependent oxidoreductase n=1 Tax=Streptomyces sp. NPDC059455 TaxID=3346837 RepID=UPI0036C6D30A